MKKTSPRKHQGHRVGYIRVSTLDQNTARQLDGIELDKVFTDKASGKDTQRPQLQEALEYVREGDSLVCHSMDRLARNLRNLLEIVECLTSKGVQVQFLKENLTFSGEDSPFNKLMLAMLGGVAEFERAMIHERQREGIEIAKTKGVYKGRKPKLSDPRVEEIKQRIAAGEKKAEIAREFGVSRQTLYSYL
jgi:DNA invertase Pin-like site-specific DNA recombinase